ncbi:MAG: hypothetical protein Q4E16_02450 [Neisseria sp.]|nr:hypothetical protein [Neisseria sp.]
MKKLTLTTFAAIAVLSSAMAAAESGSPSIEWNHANDSGAIPNLVEVKASALTKAHSDRTVFEPAHQTYIADNAPVGFVLKYADR